MTIVVKIAVISFASFKDGSILADGNRPDSDFNSNQNADLSASSWTMDNFEINSAHERPR